MRCDEVRELWWDWLRGRLPAEQRKAVEDHAAGCPACQAALDAEVRLDRVLDQAPALDAREGFARRVLSRAGRARVYRIVRWASSMAAALLLAFFLFPRDNVSSLSDEEREIVNHLDVLENMPVVETADVVEDSSAVDDIELAGDLEEEYY